MTDQPETLDDWRDLAHSWRSLYTATMRALQEAIAKHDQIHGRYLDAIRAAHISHKHQPWDEGRHLYCGSCAAGLPIEQLMAGQGPHWPCNHAQWASSILNVTSDDQQ